MLEEIKKELLGPEEDDAPLEPGIPEPPPVEPRPEK
jgi:hypothetical protein